MNRQPSRPSRALDASLGQGRAASPWLERPIRWIGILLVASLPACAFCVENTVHPSAQEHAAFCAQYLNQGKLIEAEARCKLAREFSPKYAEPVNLLGLIEYNRGHMERAVELFKEAISLKSDFAEAHNNMGAIFLERREYAYACDQFKQATEIDPGYVNARVNLALCKMYDGQPDGAKNEYLKCVELDPNACDCRMGLGVIELQNEGWDAAKTHFQKLTEVCPQNAEGFYNLCYTYFRMGRCGDAVDACISALAIKSEYIEARQNLNEAYKCLALGDAAVRKYMDQIRKNPGDAELHFNLGTLYEEKKLMERALNEYQNTIKLDPRHALAHYRAARVLDRMLRAEETVQMCKQFVDLLRDNKLTKQRDWCVTRVQELQFQ